MKKNDAAGMAAAGKASDVCMMASQVDNARYFSIFL